TVLEAHGANCGRRWADEGYAGGATGFSKFSILGQEAVTVMKTIGSFLFCGSDQFLGCEVTFGCRGRTNRISLIALPHVQSIPVRVRIHRYRTQPQSPGRARNTTGNFATVRDQ